MKAKFFYVFLFVTGSFHLSAQLCPTDTSIIREVTLPAFDSLQGYHPNLMLLLPGETLSEKGDAFFKALMDEYSSELGDKELARTEVHTSSSSSLFVYNQHENGVAIRGQRIWLKLDVQGRLRSFGVHLLDNVTDLDTIADLVSGITEPEDYSVLKMDGSWTLQTNIEPEEPALDCPANNPIDLQIGFPNHECCDVTVPVSINSTNTPFLVYRNSPEPLLCGLYANTLKSYTFSTGDGCNEVSGDLVDDKAPAYETMMCYYFLNSASHYLVEVIEPLAENAGISTFNVKNNISFDPFSQGDVGVYLQTNPPAIAFKGIVDMAGCTDNFDDYGEDADFIAGAAFEMMIRTNFETPLSPSFPNEGLLAGTIGFFTWDYMRHEANAEENFSIGNYAGFDNQKFPVELSTNRKYSQLSIVHNVRYRGSVWASTLKDIYYALDENHRDEVVYDMLLKVMEIWTENTSQYEAAILLYGEAILLIEADIINAEEFEAIRRIICYRFADGDPHPLNGSEFDFYKDLYIKDTHEGENTGEDVGFEPNLYSKIYDRSPSIWNCRTANCTQNQRPALGEVNFLRISVHDQGCDWSFLDCDLQNNDGVLQAYVNLATTSSLWPLQWGGDTNNDNVPDPYYINFNGYNILAAQHVGQVCLTDALAYEDLGDERIYTIPWTPWNPIEEDPNNKSKFLRNLEHQGYLVRLVSTQDPMAEELARYSNINVKKNNNIAQRKAGIIHPLYESNEIISPILSTMIIRHNAPGITPGDVSLRFEYINSEFTMNDDNFDSLGVVRVECSPELLATFVYGLPQGPGHIWINDSTFQITGKDFDLPLQLIPGVAYPVLVEYVPTGTLIPVSFRFSQIQEDGCYEGGQYYDVSHDFVSPRTSSQEEKGNASDPDSISGYPNPAFDTYTIVTKGTDDIDQLSVYNTLGEKVYNNRTPDTRTISTSGWPGGLYVIEVRLVSGAIKTLTFVHLN